MQGSLLRLVLGKDEHVLARWKDLQPLDIDTLDPGSFCLLPWLFRRLDEQGIEEPLLPRLAGTYRSTWYRNRLQLGRLSGIVSELRERGIEPLPYGGATLAALWYPQPGLRPLHQIDAIVPPGSGAGAREALRAAGWRPTGSGRGFRRFVSGENLVFVAHEGVPPYLAGPVEPERALRSLLEGAREHDLGGVGVATLDGADELLVACVLGARTTTFPTVQWLLDAACLLAAPDRLDAARLVDRTRLFQIAAPVRETIAYLDEISETLDLGALREALARVPTARRDLYAYRLAGASTGRLGSAPRTAALHLRLTAGTGMSRTLARLPQHLQETWEIQSRRQVPGIAVRKLARIVSRSGSGGPAADQRREADPSTERNRSALS